MFDWTSWLLGLVALLLFGVASWLVSVFKRDVSIVDSLWSLMFLIAVVIYTMLSSIEVTGHALLLITLLAIWALRLSAYISWRNWGEGEDYRYQEIRLNNDPGFWFKSLYIVFGLQAVLAWLIATPIPAAMNGAYSVSTATYIGLALWIIGMVFEVGGDWQLARFKADPSNKGKVLDQGLWRYTRHPNYFGEACVWWGFYFVAVDAGAWWTIFSPIIITILLLRVSGVTLLEKDIVVRRPAYRAYIARTNTFFPGPPKQTLSSTNPGTAK